MRKTTLSLGLAAGLALSGPPVTAAEPEISEPGAIYNYILGYQVTARVLQKLEQDGVAVSDEAFRAGMEDRLGGEEPRFSKDEVVAAIERLQSDQKSKQDAEAAANLAEGEAFLTENAERDEVNVMDSGLQYIESEAGSGAQPGEDSTVVVHYRGTLVDGEEFDSSYARGEPAKFAASGVIPGFREALLSMREGAKWRVFIPAELGYGERGAGDRIGPNQTLIFDLELIEVVSEESEESGGAAAGKERPR